MDKDKFKDNYSSLIEMEDLPDEMIEFILTYLSPYEDLDNCRLVCKRWSSIVKNLIRRSRNNLHKGLIDYRLRWEVFTQETATDVAANTADSLKQGLPFIAGRFAHSAVRHRNSMYIFGGGSSSDTTFNDLWRFDLSEMRWERPLSLGSYPSPKGSATIVEWREKLVLFGGWRYPSLHPPYQPWCLFDELHFYELASNRWHVCTSSSSPPPVAGHSATVIGDRMVVFGGYRIAESINSNSNETWCLELLDQRWWQPRLADNKKPPPRYGQFQFNLDDTHILIVGGCGGPNDIKQDAWVLDMSKDIWAWRAIPMRNKKYAATHMWCNPACKIGTKLVALGPTPTLPQDFQIMKQTRVPVGGGMAGPRHGAQPNNRNNPFERQPPPGWGIGMEQRILPNHNRVDNYRLVGLQANGPEEQYLANRRAILDQHQQNANNFLNNINNNNNQLQPRTGRLSDLHAPVPAAPSAEERNQNRPSTSPRLNGRADNDSAAGSNGSNNPNDIEAANRLQRNLALRCRENEPLLPKRFDELHEDRFRMAAFNVSRLRSISKDHSERIRRMEEKLNALRNSCRNAMIVQKSVKQPPPKRMKRNVLSLFVCELSAALSEVDPHLEWVEYKDFGIIPGAPERHLILSSLVAGHGELILFGGVHKETLGELTHQVSNSVHFLSAPKDIV
ncbi:F-box only protein 42 [Teleopsis dalmanni]|uniref:F-box only protein 42 n=1 Tax=Teleopsis dalmanni TaxID=139649 RepID=UPI0018CE7808|nr:F-box only protein 42 [Teleopsis dalmanni]